MGWARSFLLPVGLAMAATALASTVAGSTFGEPAVSPAVPVQGFSVHETGRDRNVLFELVVDDVTTEYTITQTYPPDWVPNHLHVHGHILSPWTFEGGVLTLKVRPTKHLPLGGPGSYEGPVLSVSVLCYAPGFEERFRGISIASNSPYVSTSWDSDGVRFSVGIKVEGPSNTRGYLSLFFPSTFAQAVNYTRENTTVTFDGQDANASQSLGPDGLHIDLPDYPHSVHSVLAKFNGGVEGFGGATSGIPNVGAVLAALVVLAPAAWQRVRGRGRS